jgi:hypothetical protein
MTEEANASGNALDMPTSVWSEMARKKVWNRCPVEKANDGQRLLADASQNGVPMEHSSQRLYSPIAKWLGGIARPWVNPQKSIGLMRA